jgi:hypothetical protein
VALSYDPVFGLATCMGIDSSPIHRTQLRRPDKVSIIKENSIIGAMESNTTTKECKCLVLVLDHIKPLDSPQDIHMKLKESL